MGARCYDPNAAGFISPDPLGHTATPDLYSYALGDPINFFDPTGRMGKGMFEQQNEPFTVHWSVELGADIAGSLEPTPFIDIANAGYLWNKEDYFGSVTTAVGAFPYAGDLVGKGAKWTGRGVYAAGEKVVEYGGKAIPYIEKGATWLGDKLSGSLENWSGAFDSAAATIKSQFGIDIAPKLNVVQEGGMHRDTRLPVNDGLDSHHTPSRQSYEHTSIDMMDGPAIKMEPKDHRKTASYGGGPNSKQQAYRDKQKELINQGAFDEAFLMDVEDIQSKFGSKYDEAILKAMNALPD